MNEFNHMFLLALVSSIAVLDTAHGIDIVREGQPVAVVAVDAGAPEQVKEAANLLVDYVERATGARLPVVDALPADGSVICVGPGGGWETPDQSGLDDDGFDIAFPNPTTVVIVGPTAWGTEFGVCEFLERYVGVRWLLPGEHGDDVPVNKNLSVPAEPVRQAPVMFSRQFSGLQGAEQSTWARRNRMRGRVSFPPYLLHSLSRRKRIRLPPRVFSRSITASVFCAGQQRPPLAAVLYRAGYRREAVKNITGVFEPTLRPRRTRSARTTAAAIAHARTAWRASPARRISWGGLIIQTFITIGPIRSSRACWIYFPTSGLDAWRTARWPRRRRMCRFTPG